MVYRRVCSMRYSISAFLNVIGILSCLIRVHISGACVGGGRGRPIFQNGGQSYKLRLLQRAGAAAHVYMYMCVCVRFYMQTHIDV